MPIISVIIPAYNAAGYLERCLGSLRDQTFEDWEAVCVDDGSTDGTGALLDAFAAGDPRIRVIHKANEGVSVARNTGVSQAEGRYLLFVDSDDFLHPRTMEITFSLAERDGSDLVCFTYDHGYRTRLIVRHALGNALIPVLTVIGLGLGNLLGGMVLVETIFNWPGVGQFAYQSVMSADFPAIIGVALLIALNYMVINTVVDILYGVIDPRVRYG